MLELLYFGCSRNNWSISVVEWLSEPEQGTTATRVTDNDNSDVNDPETWWKHYKSMMFAMGLHIMEQEPIDIDFHPKFLLQHAPKALRNVGVPSLGTLVAKTSNSSHISNVLGFEYYGKRGLPIDIAVADSHDDVDLG